jgi:hypothetical protein
MGRTIEPLPLDETFPREYEIEWLRDLPNSDKVKLHGEDPGPILRVIPEGGDAFVVIVPGLAGTMTLSTMPNPREFAVFNRREMPVIINIDRPGDLAEIAHFRGHGLRNVFRLREAGVVVMNSCCDLIGWGEHGILWEHRSDLFCCDEPIVDVVGSQVMVDGETHQNPGRRRILVDARTGQVD